MPTYSYRCTACDHTFDAQQAFTDDSLTVCPNCGGVLRKVFNSIGVTFKGTGFYRTDSRSTPKKTTVSSSDSGAGSSSSSSESSSPPPSATPATSESTSSSSTASPAGSAN